MDPVAPSHDPYAPLRLRDFRILLISTFLMSAIGEMVSVALGWELYDRTGKALALGLVGVVQVVPVVLLALPAGHFADRYNRKYIFMVCAAVYALGALSLTILSETRGSLVLVYATLFVIGVVRAFESPAASALPAQVVTKELYESSATWTSGTWQASSILGPAIGGLLIALRGDATFVYGLSAVLLLVLVVLLGIMKIKPSERSHEQVSVSSLFAGLRFVRDTKIILAAITLDLFAVLFGGATALLPIVAKEILHVGPTGLGILRAAPAVGALIAALTIAHLPPFKHAGRVLLSVVGGFGLATIVFGFSRSFPLSLLMLAFLGVFDNISVVIRSTLLLLQTPDSMRGRVGAVHYVFIGLSNEMGAFESGIAATLLGTVGAIVFGGVGTLAVVFIVARAWPEIRNLRRLDGSALPES